VYSFIAMSTFDFKSLQTLAIDDSVEGLLVINLNRPKAHNAFSSQMIEEWGALLNYLETAFQHRVCVVQGNVSRRSEQALSLFVVDWPYVSMHSVPLSLLC
jgi:1,4-dihydroxy-2-naphthoyl-CoA synthase